MAEKVTIMKLKVDLDCDKCYKKVKKLLCKYPQIRDQKYDEKANIIAITVVCCSPEKIRDKLCCKGGGSIKSIEIVEPPKPKPAEPEKKKEADKPKVAEKPKPADKPKSAEPEKKKEADKPKAAEPEKKKEADKPKSDAPKKDGEKPKPKPAEADKPKDKPAPAPIPVNPQPQMPPPMAIPVGMCLAPPPQCYELGRPVGPYYNEYGGPGHCYDGYYARPVYDSYGGNRSYYPNRCDQYLSEENPTGCNVM